MTSDSLRAIRYPKVPRDWDQRFLYLAASVAAWSKDPSTKVGAVAVRQRRVLATGYNGLPAGMLDSKERLLNREIRLALTIHAELNLVTFAARHGICLDGSTLIDEADRILDQEVRAFLYREIGVLHYDLAPLIALPAATEYIITSDRISGVYFNPMRSDEFLWKDISKN